MGRSGSPKAVSKMSGELHQHSELWSDLFLLQIMQNCSECPGGKSCHDSDCYKRFDEQATKIEMKIGARYAGNRI